MSDISTLKDEELVKKYREGDNAALDELFSRMKSIVVSTAHSYFLIGGDVEDLIQEGMIGLLRSITTYDTSKNVKFRSFANTCIKTAILDSLKVANREKHKALNDSISLQDMSPDFLMSLSPEEEFIDEEKNKQIREEIKSFLNTPQKKLLDLYLDGYSYNEIASIMKKDRKYVDNTLQIIKRKIRTNLGDKYKI